MVDVLTSLVKEGHLTQAQARAGYAFLKELQQYHGTSAGLVGQVQERVDMTTRSRLAPPDGGGMGTGSIDLIVQGLRPHEQDLLRFLVIHKELPRGSLADWGRQNSGYKTPKTCKAMAVGAVRSMLDSMAAIYGAKPEPQHWSGSRYARAAPQELDARAHAAA
jgi:hypothetical protein